MKVTSITIGGNEWVTKAQLRKTKIVCASGGVLGTASVVVEDAWAGIAAITLQDEIILYAGATKIFGGFIAKMSTVSPAPGLVRATLTCQDYTVLLERAALHSIEEEFTDETDEAILDHLFMDYLPGISTADVNTVQTLDSLVLKPGTSMRKAVEQIADRSGAEWYVDADKRLQYYDPTTDSPATPFVVREDVEVHSDGVPAFNWTTDATASFNGATFELTENGASSGHYMRGYGYSVTSGEVYTFSVDCKPNGRDWIALGSEAYGYFHTYFNLSTGAIGTETALHYASIVGLGDGWYRCTVRIPADVSGVRNFNMYMASADTVWSYSGDGSSGVFFRNAYIGDGRPFLRRSFHYSKDFSTPANHVHVVGFPATEIEDSTTPAVSGSESDGHVHGEGLPWPPAYVDSNDGAEFVVYYVGKLPGPGYIYQMPLLKFDTSGLPVTAVITQATLKVWGSGVYNFNNRIGIEWYDADNWRMGESDYSTTPANDAFGFGSPSLGSLPGWIEFILKSPDLRINKTGETGLRFSSNRTSNPSSYEIFTFDAVDKGGGTPAILVIEYTTAATSGFAEDAASVALYGEHARNIIDDTITTDEECDLRAEVEVTRWANPKEIGKMLLDADGVSVGDILTIDAPSHGIDDDYHVNRVTISWETNERSLYTVEFGDHHPDALTLLRQLAQEHH